MLCAPFRTVLPVLITLSLSSCAEHGPTQYAVKGVVTYQGEPLPIGRVVFVSDSHRPSSSLIGEDGSYQLKSVPGQIRVEVVANAYQEHGGLESKVKASVPLIPDRYNRYHSSGITVQVEEVELNEIDIHLE